MIRSLFKILRPPSKPVKPDLFRILADSGSIPKELLVQKGNTVMHLGVWRTETIEQWSKLVGCSGKVIIVEADTLNHKINQIEVRRRLLSNVTLVNKAAWNKRQSITLQVSDLSMRNKIMETQTIDRLNPDSNYESQLVVQGETIDNMLKALNISKVDHVYMTISGAELEALEGMTNTIDNNALSIYIRAILINSKTKQSNADVVANYLRHLGLLANAAPKEKDRDGSNVFAIKS